MKDIFKSENTRFTGIRTNLLTGEDQELSLSDLAQIDVEKTKQIGKRKKGKPLRKK